MLIILQSSLYTAVYSYIINLILTHSYFAIIFLMILESASLPVPSEVILPAIGLFAYRSMLDPYIGLAAALLGGLIGIAIDYYLAFYLGKEIVYKHVEKFHIKKETLKKFDIWFNENGVFAVFIGRLMPIVRGLISFPAGFAGMNKKKFFFYSLLGSLVWDSALITFGYYALPVKNVPILFSAIALLGIVLYAIYHIATKSINKKRSPKK